MAPSLHDTTTLTIPLIALLKIWTNLNQQRLASGSGSPIGGSMSLLGGKRGSSIGRRDSISSGIRHSTDYVSVEMSRVDRKG